MKPWQYLLMGVFFGLAASAIILIISSTPRGTPVQLIPTGTPKPITIHIAGSVAKPGVYMLPSGSRVIDAINLAGGMTQNAAEAVNLAAILQDGQKLTIPAAQAYIVAPGEQVTGNLIQGNLAQTRDKININTAPVNELETLPGIGNLKASAIVEYRLKFGPFRSTLEIQNVPGIGAVIYEKIKDFIYIE